MKKEELYDTKISPLMAQIITLCKEYDISFLCSFQLATEQEDPEEEYFCTSAWVTENTSKMLREATQVVTKRIQKAPNDSIF